MLRVAEAAGLTDLAAQLAGLIETAEGRTHDDARFPIPTLRPAGGFRMDPALVYALDPAGIELRTGRRVQRGRARPDAAHAGDGQLHERGRRHAPALYAQRLHDPATNLSIGQSYVIYLASHDRVNTT